jgi:hypothetical protein
LLIILKFENVKRLVLVLSISLSSVALFAQVPSPPKAPAAPKAPAVVAPKAPAAVTPAAPKAATTPVVAPSVDGSAQVAPKKKRQAAPKKAAETGNYAMKYKCAKGCAVLSDGGGKCPKCGGEMVGMAPEASAPATHTGAHKGKGRKAAKAAATTTPAPATAAPATVAPATPKM